MRLLGHGDQLLTNGEDPAEVCGTLGISESSYHRWRTRYGGTGVDDAIRLKELETENVTLKRQPADAEGEKATLKESAKGNWWARARSGLSSMN